MTLFSVNINKVATIRNARGGDIPNVVDFALACERYGADGITVHPRPDERHIRYQDVYELKNALSCEFNIEGYPTEDFIKLVLDVQPTQVTLVPDKPEQLTSDHGWDIGANVEFLRSLIADFHKTGVRVSLFINPDSHVINDAVMVETDRVELFTGPYAELHRTSPKQALSLYTETAYRIRDTHILGMNAGHDLNLHNLNDFVKNFPWVKEVSIGQSFITDCLYYGVEEAIGMYKECLRV